MAHTREITVLKFRSVKDDFKKCYLMKLFLMIIWCHSFSETVGRKLMSRFGASNMVLKQTKLDTHIFHIHIAKCKFVKWGRIIQKS